MDIDRLTSSVTRAGILVGVLAVTSLPAAAAASSGKLDASGDVRVRLEQDYDSVDALGVARADRLRLRVRARLGLRYRHNAHLDVGVRLRSGSDLSQQSPHITLLDFDDNDTGDADFNLDQWYLRGTRGRFWSWVGRNSHPFWRQNEMLFDDDATLAGVAVGWSRAGERGTLGLRGGRFSLPVGMRAFAGDLSALQVVYERPGEIGFTLAAGFWAFEARPDDPDAASLLDGNGGRDYSVVELSGQLQLIGGSRPLTLGVDVMTNTRSYSAADPDPFTAANHDRTDGVVVSASYGSLDRAGLWLAGYTYARVEPLAVNGSYAEDDWVRWGSAGQTRGSNLKGHELRFGYGLSRHAHLLLRLYLVDAITSVEDGSRARLDLNVTF